MSYDPIDYTELANEAMHLIVYKILKEVQKNGMPHDRQFAISFDTTHSKVKISSKLLQVFPQEMTIILQSPTEEINVYPKGFIVNLNAKEMKEKIYIPFSAILSFADPIGQFSLQFQQPSTDKTKNKSLTQKQYDEDLKAQTQIDDPNSNVVSFEKFKRKHSVHKVSRNWL